MSQGPDRFDPKQDKKPRTLSRSSYRYQFSASTVDKLPRLIVEPDGKTSERFDVFIVPDRNELEVSFVNCTLIKDLRRDLQVNGVSINQCLNQLLEPEDKENEEKLDEAA